MPDFVPGESSRWTSVDSQGQLVCAMIEAGGYVSPLSPTLQPDLNLRRRSTNLRLD